MARCCCHFLTLYIYIFVHVFTWKYSTCFWREHFWSWKDMFLELTVTRSKLIFAKKKTYSQYPSRWPILQSSLTVWLRGANPSNMVSDVFFIYSNSYLNIPEVYQEIQEWLYLFFSFRLWPSGNTCIYTLLYMLERLTSVNFTCFSTPEKKTLVYTILLLGFGKFLDV